MEVVDRSVRIESLGAQLFRDRSDGWQGNAKQCVLKSLTQDFFQTCRGTVNLGPGARPPLERSGRWQEPLYWAAWLSLETRLKDHPSHLFGKSHEEIA